MKNLFFAMLLGSAVILGACGGSDTKESGSTETVEVDGEKVVQQKCISCHGDKLNNGSALDISKIGSKLTEEEIAKVIKDGQGAMPAGLIDGDEAKAVSEWLATQK